MSTLGDDGPDGDRRRDYRGTDLYALAKREMHREMALFPWKAMTDVEMAQEKDAREAGFTTQRQADAQQVTHAETLVEHILETSMLEAGEEKILVTLTSDEERMPRSRGIVLTLQAIVNAGIPAFICDREAPPNENHDFSRHFADLVIVIPD